MQDKIELYKDILISDPFSRVFYPLGLALKEQKNLEDAAHYLEQGLTYHTNFLEARMCLVEVFAELGAIEKQNAEIEKIVDIFRKFPHFWEAWAQKEHGGNEDIAVALHFVSKALHTTDLTLTQVLASGLQHLPSTLPYGANIENSSIQCASKVEYSTSDMASVVHEEDTEHARVDASIHTRSMADLLAEQGELEQALLIYKELLEQEEDVEIKAELKFIIQEFEARLKEDSSHIVQQTSNGSNKENLINTLATLVSRLDARAEAIQTRV